MSIDHATDASRQDAMKELQHALAAKARQVTVFAAGCIVLGLIAAYCALMVGWSDARSFVADAERDEAVTVAAAAIRNTTEAIRIAAVFRDALHAERARYRACFADRERGGDEEPMATVLDPGAR